MKQHPVVMGSGDTVALDKLCGPTGLAALRITADTDRVGWVIERELAVGGEDHGWVEWCFIPGQLPIEYAEAKEGAR